MSCNIHYGITDNLFRRLQSTQDAAARLLTGTERRDHISQFYRACTGCQWSNESSSNWPLLSSSRCAAKPHRTSRTTASWSPTPDGAVFARLTPMPSLSRESFNYCKPFQTWLLYSCAAADKVSTELERSKAACWFQSYHRGQLLLHIIWGSGSYGKEDLPEGRVSRLEKFAAFSTPRSAVTAVANVW